MLRKIKIAEYLIVLLLCQSIYGADGDPVYEGLTAATIDVTQIDFQNTGTITGLDSIDATSEATLESALDHDDLTGFVANEHIDWTADQGATNIHSGNYTDTNTTYTAGGTLLNLTGTTFSLYEGTLTNGKYCTYVTGTGLVCNSEGGSGILASTFTTDGGVIVGTGAGTYQEETGATLRTSLGLGTGNTPQFTGLNLGTGEATLGSINRAASGLELKIAGSDVLVLNDSSIQAYQPLAVNAGISGTRNDGNNLGLALSVGSTGTPSAYLQIGTPTATWKLNTLNGNGDLNLQIGGYNALNINYTTYKVTGLGDYSVGSGTGELTAGSINRASGTLTHEIGGTAELSIATGVITVKDGGKLKTDKIEAYDSAGLQLFEDGGVGIFIADNTGNIGIGTTSPADSQGYGRALDIQSSSYGAAIYLRDSDDTSKYAFFGYDSSTLATTIGSYGANSYFRFYAGTSETARLEPSGALLINATSLIGTEKLRVNGQIYCDDNVSALTFTDRTPFYEGDALSELMKIKGKNGQIDHNTLPAFARKQTITKDQNGIEIVEEGRDLGAMISIQTVSIQQLYNEIQKLKARIDELEKNMPKFEKADNYNLNTRRAQ
jgi:hypothetical protein